MNTKHTPGPWEYDRNAGHIVAQGISVCRISACSGYGEHDDNARLIAAAPDLLTALQACYDAMQAAQAYIPPNAMAYRDEVVASLLHARAVLAQATGSAT